jgi:hypothetical protein
VTIDKPTHIVAGDAMIADCVTNGTDITGLSGGATWTGFGAQTSFGGPPYLGEAFYKIAGDGEPTTYTLSTTGGTDHGCYVASYRSVAQTSPLDVTDDNTGTGTSLTCGSITTSAANAIAVCTCITETSGTITPPSGYTEQYDAAGNFFISEKLYASAGATGDQTATFSTSTAWACRHTAFKYNTSGVRIYLPSTGAPAVSPTFGAVWEDNDQGDRIAAVFTRGSTAMTNHTSNEETADVTAIDHLNRQYVIQIGAQTVSGVLQCNARSFESNGAANAHAVLYAWLADSEGASTSEVLLDTTGVATDTDEFAGGTEARNYPRKGDTHTTTSQTAANNDHVIVEFGAFHNNTASNARTHQTVFGDTSATELERDDANTVDNHPWCDFLGGLAAPAAPSCTGGWITLLGAGCH